MSPCVVDDLPDNRKLWERLRDFEKHHEQEVDELRAENKRLKAENAKLRKTLDRLATK